MTRTIVKLAIASISIFWFAASASSQAGLAADHGNKPQTPVVHPSTAKAHELQTRIDDQQVILRDLRHQIDEQAGVAESAREMAAEAGALGDLASVFIEEWVREQKKLDELKKELAPRIIQTEQTLAALQAQQRALSAEVVPKNQPVRAAKRSTEPARKHPMGNTEASLQAKQ